MNYDKLCNADPEVARDYVLKKFKGFNGWAYPKSKRIQKCIDYYLAAEGPPDRQEVVEMAYQDVFRQLFPVEQAEKLAAARQQKASRLPQKRESSAWMENKQEELQDAHLTLEKLRRWKAEQDYQLGDGFMLQLKTAVAFLEDDLLEEEGLHTEWEDFRVASLTGSALMEGNTAKAEFDAMIGLKQRAAISFAAKSDRLGEINAKLEESFKLGAWANGSAAAKMSQLGFSIDMQMAVAIGAHLEVAGDLTWTKGRVGMQLAGAADVFAGAKADASLKLSAHALKGIEASIQAGAFAGFKAEVSGTCSFAYGGQKLVSATGTAGVAFGVGAEFSASIKSSIFGPTEIAFDAGITLLTGGTTSAKVAVHFGGIYLAGKSEFQRLVYLPTIMRGYKQDLMTQDTENLFYLNKCIVRVGAHIEELEGRIAKIEKTPMEKRSLLQYD